MTLGIGEREPGYVDAYYGPPEWRDAAKAAPRSVEDLAREATALAARVNAVGPVTMVPLEQTRTALLIAKPTATPTPLRTPPGPTSSFAAHTDGLYAVRIVYRAFLPHLPVRASTIAQ